MRQRCEVPASLERAQPKLVVHDKVQRFVEFAGHGTGPPKYLRLQKLARCPPNIPQIKYLAVTTDVT